MLEFLKKLFSPVEETVTAQELQALSSEPLSRKDAEHIALDITIGIARQKKADQNAK
ncbi:hypothetical protein COO91_01919 [Nostoc flagelliforme CCNUN1]|uniref:Uncharacterized protein n=1 Tax=Nostoc flagelliforme CCNUN1 TaxID=2038116 RepID=A0A2K8SKZ0_9NOSO|nr:hypothetical protein [Nostoc flagelliforme]AUB36020.1 hypothetical protein COO91_01919 [Nostoc flagelliforme CCNUN1]